MYLCAGLRLLQGLLQKMLQAMVLLPELCGHNATEVSQQMLHSNFDAFAVDKFSFDNNQRWCWDPLDVHSPHGFGGSFWHVRWKLSCPTWTCHRNSGFTLLGLQTRELCVRLCGCLSFNQAAGGNSHSWFQHSWLLHFCRFS